MLMPTAALTSSFGVSARRLSWRKSVTGVAGGSRNLDLCPGCLSNDHLPTQRGRLGRSGRPPCGLKQRLLRAFNIESSQKTRVTFGPPRAYTFLEERKFASREEAMGNNGRRRHLIGMRARWAALGALLLGGIAACLVMADGLDIIWSGGAPSGGQ